MILPESPTDPVVSLFPRNADQWARDAFIWCPVIRVRVRLLDVFSTIV
jgi:hypothetical protein